MHFGTLNGWYTTPVGTLSGFFDTIVSFLATFNTFGTVFTSLRLVHQLRLYTTDRISV